MKPCSFSGQNVVFAKDQPQYQPLPAHVSESGTVTTCWKLSVVERVAVFVFGRIWWTQLTFNRPLQPVKPSVEAPVLEEKRRPENKDGALQTLRD